MNIEEVVRSRNCRSCGYCFSVCPANAINMAYVDGFFRPEVNENQCVQCGKCVKCCPAENEFTETGLLGHYIKMQLAHSSDCKVRHNATSGGVINSLVRFLLRNRSLAEF